MRERYPLLAALLERNSDADAFDRLRGAESIGRPLGDTEFLDRLEAATGRVLKPAKRGPKPRREMAGEGV